MCAFVGLYMNNKSTLMYGTEHVKFMYAFV
jgi:hypothetical protein